MIKKAIKPVLKKMVLKVQNYVRAWEEEHAREERATHRNYDEDDFAYPWLNDQFTQMLKGGSHVFRPPYTWGVLQGAHLARALGVKRISVIEFGVAGGNGLISLERVAERTEESLGIHIDVYGFDTGAGLPKPVDYRDLPNLWRESAFSMDVERLKQRLKKAQLMLGSVGETVVDFIESCPAPVAFISFDLDYYSSTMGAFKLLEADCSALLPRVYCYFDDIMGFTFSDFTGERLAIKEFNASHSMRKISPIYGLRYYLPAPHRDAMWLEKFYIAHLFDHNLYSQHDGLVQRIVGDHTALTSDR